MVEQKSKRALGRGLSSLLDEISDEVDTERSEGALQVLSVDQISPNANQPRKYFDDQELAELADSIKLKGVIQPILVRPMPGSPGEYEIVAGERRWRAAQKARLHEVPVVIRELEDSDALEIALIENVQRSDLNAVEEALAYKHLMDKYEYTQETLAKNVGKSRAHIANMTRLLNLPDEVLHLVRTGEISAGHARTLLGSTDPVSFAKMIVKKQMSVRAVENAMKTDKPKPRGAPFQQNDADTRALEEQLSDILQMKVSIRQKGEKGGELAIAYRSLDDLEELSALLSGQDRAVFASG